MLIKPGDYVVKFSKDLVPIPLEGFVAEECPACNGGGKVGGRHSEVMTCPICRGQKVVLTQVPLDEAMQGYRKQTQLVQDDSSFEEV